MTVNFIISSLLLLFIFWTLFGPRYLISNTRKKLYSIRTKLFLDYSLDAEYPKLRDEIDLFIKFASRASWQRMLFDFLFLRKELKKVQHNKTNFKNPEFENILSTSTTLILRLIVLRSPTLMLLSGPLFIIAVIKVEMLPKIKNIAHSFFMIRKPIKAYF